MTPSRRGGPLRTIDHFVMAVTAQRRMRGYVIHVDRWASLTFDVPPILEPRSRGASFFADCTFADSCGNPGGSLEATHRSFNKDFLLALAADFKKHGAAAIEKVRKQQPAANMKICALLVRRKMKLELSAAAAIKELTDEQLEQSIALLKEMIAKRDAAANAKVIEGVAESVPALPPPSRKARRKVRRSDRADSGLAARVVGTDSADGNS